MTYIGHSAFLPHWFVRRRGIAIGIAFSGVGVGSILLFPWLQQQIVTVGWRSASLTMALLLVVLVVPINLLLQRGRPQDLGLTADGDPPHHDGSAPSRHPETIVDKAWAATEWTLPKALATRRFWWLCLGYFCGLMVWYSVQVHQTRYLLELGLGSEAAALALGLVGFSSIGGLIFVGHLSDRIGREWAWTLAYAGFAASYALLLVLPQVPSAALAYTMAILQGGLGYGMAAVFGAIPAEIFEGKRFGTIYGMISLAGGLGAGAGPWLTGLVYDATGSYDGAFWLMLVAAAVSAGSVWMASPRKVRLVAGQAARRAHRHGA
jgi:MFS family permease